MDKLTESGVQVENLDLAVVEELDSIATQAWRAVPPLADVVLHLDRESVEDLG